MIRKKSLISALSITLIFAFLLSFSAFAWFALIEQSELPIGFKTASMDDVTIKLATASHSGEESTRTYKTLDSGLLDMQKPSIAEGSTLYNITLSDMSFGSIDNLSKFKPENIVYLQITLPKSYGSEVNFKLGSIHENGYFFDLYQNVIENDIVTGQNLVTGDTSEGLAMLDGLKNIQMGTNPEIYLNYSFAFSSKDYAASAISAAEESNELSFLQKNSSGSDLTFNADFNAENSVIDTLICPDNVMSSEGDTYYLYIKIIPNLSAFALSIEYISLIMPCFMLFRTGMSFEIIPAKEVVN